MAGRLNFLTCGSVDDGKSTLIGRLLFDAGQLMDDELATLEKDSRAYGTQGRRLDFALLVDGLREERKQGITIDVAYRYFSTAKRSFVVADAPGHEQYTKSMAMAASNAEAAVVLVDARSGVLPQTTRHLRILSTMGVNHVMLAVNKMDLIGWDRRRFEDVVSAFTTVADSLAFSSHQAVPTSALGGENVFTGGNIDWYKGPTLIDWLEAVPRTETDATSPLLLPVQSVLRPDSEFRGYCGRLARGSLEPGDEIVVMPSAVKCSVDQLLVAGEPAATAVAGDSVCVTFLEKVDVVRGDVISDANHPVSNGREFEARLVWLSRRQLLPGTTYWLKLHCATVPALVDSISYKLDHNTEGSVPATALDLNDLAIVTLSLDRSVPYTTYQQNHRLGGFILIDRRDNSTAGAGMITSELSRQHDVTWQTHSIDKRARALQKVQQPACVWLTGLSGAGKSTIADRLERQLFADGAHTYLLDGDNIRHGLNRDLGFSEADRAENVRRVAEAAKLLVDAGLIAIVALISPYRSERERARRLFDRGEFVEVFVDTPLEICESRDAKGLYARARNGEIPNFTGITSPYEPPRNPEIHLRTPDLGIEECVREIAALLQKAGAHD